MSFEAFLAVVLAVNLVCAVIAALVAARWGRDPFSWVLVCAVLGPFGLVALVALRPDTTPRPAPVRTGGTAGPPTSRRRILVPVDTSENALPAVEYAKGVVQRSGGQITLLAVFPIERADAPGAEPASSRRIEFENECHEYFDGPSGLLTEAGVPYETKVAFGNPADEILRLAHEAPFDLIVIGRRGRGLSKALLGSVSEKVIQNARVPVTLAS
jgi:nucleotide-binding universal stress UspA family protein